jgi:hypothetical protein
VGRKDRRAGEDSGAGRAQDGPCAVSRPPSGARAQGGRSAQNMQGTFPLEAGGASAISSAPLRQQQQKLAPICVSDRDSEEGGSLPPTGGKGSSGCDSEHDGEPSRSAARLGDGSRHIDSTQSSPRVQQPTDRQARSLTPEMLNQARASSERVSLDDCNDTETMVSVLDASPGTNDDPRRDGGGWRVSKMTVLKLPQRKGIAAIDTGDTWWKRELKKRNLVEVYEPGHGRRNCGLYRRVDNEEPRPVSPVCEDRQWWKMNQPRSGPDFRVDPTTHDFFQFEDAAGEEIGSGGRGRGDKGRCRSNQQKPCANTNTRTQHLPFLVQEGGKRKDKVPEFVPELCDFRVGDQVLAAADGAWYISTVLEVDQKKCLVKIGEDNTRLIEFTPSNSLPAKPEDGHRLLNCTVHVHNLPHPWIGKFVIDVTRESEKMSKRKTPKGDWIFRREQCGEEEDVIIEKTANPSEKELAFLYRWNAEASGSCGASCGSGAQKVVDVKRAVEQTVESAEKMYPFVTGCADFCIDIAVPANIDETYGGESCFRCGDVGLLCLCSECRINGAVCETVVCFECLDRPADRQKYDPALGGYQDWFCAKCTTARFNRDRERKSVVNKDKHVQFVLEQFHVKDQDPLSALQPPGMYEVLFKMAEIENMPKDFAIGLIVGPSGTGKTLMLRSGFGYDDSLRNSKWDDDLAVISQVHPDPEEAMTRLMTVGISSQPDMCRPFKDLSTGQQDCAHMARALGHGAVFDEFGSTLGPLGVLKLCRGMRRFVRERGLGNVVVATCNTQIASILKPDWVITTGLGPSNVGFRLFEPGYWGPDQKHRVEGALDAVSSRLLAGRAGQWSEEEVNNLKTQYRLFEQQTERAGSAAEKVKAVNSLLDLQLIPQPLASSLRIQIRSTDRRVWAQFKDSHYKGSQELSPSAHVFIATLPDHGNGLSRPLSLTTLTILHVPASRYSS